MADRVLWRIKLFQISPQPLTGDGIKDLKFFL